jgi:hypothetical protein
MVKGRFPFQDTVEQRACLAPRNSKDVRGSALGQEFGKVISGVHKECFLT